MCGRYVTVRTIEEIEKQYQVMAERLDAYQPNVNVSVGQYAPVITDARPRLLQFYQFGLTPHWAKKRMYLFNARSEGDFNKDNDPQYSGAMGILQKPAFRRPIRSQRCLVLADAFIEGSKEQRLNAPFLIYSRDPKMRWSMAGIWETWAAPDGSSTVQSFSILTTTANDLLQRIGHHRSPVVLTGEEETIWLDNASTLADVTALLQPFDPGKFNAYPISPDIKSPKAEDPALLKPLGPLIYKEHDYIIHKDEKLFGMGERRGGN